MARTPIRVSVVNDYEVVTAGVAALLAAYPDRVTVSEANRALPPSDEVDVLLFDTFASPTARDRLQALIDRVGLVMVFSWANTQQQIDDSLEAGACGFLSKASTAEEIVEAIEAVQVGKVVSALPAPGGSPMEDWPGRSHELSPREAEVISLVVRGLSTREISDDTYLSQNTVKTYLRTAYRKMGVSSRSQAVVWGMRHGFRPS
jgi:NarL family two-component system response regulator LiaR